VELKHILGMNVSLFQNFDGHGGHEVTELTSEWTSKNLPTKIPFPSSSKNNNEAKAKNMCNIRRYI